MLNRAIHLLILCCFTTSAFASPVHETEVQIERNMRELAAQIPADIRQELLGSEAVAMQDDELNQADLSQSMGPEDPVNGDRLKLVGRGVENRKTGNVIALACIGKPINETLEPSCKVLRHVMMKADTKQMVYIGPKFEIESQGEPTQDDLVKRVVSINRAVKKHKKYVNSDKRGKAIAYSAVISSVGFGAIVISKSAAGVAIATGPFCLAWLGLLVVIFGVQELVRAPLFPSSGVISDVMADQNGWNWSVKPKKVSARSFKWFESYLTR
jgi:hypothetical protein